MGDQTSKHDSNLASEGGSDSDEDQDVPLCVEEIRHHQRDVSLSTSHTESTFVREMASETGKRPEYTVKKVGSVLEICTSFLGVTSATELDFECSATDMEV